MRKSKLESYEEILGVLIKKPATLDRIAYKTSMDCTTVKQRLESLINYALVEERFSGKKTMYALTERGMAVFRTLNFQRYLAHLTDKIRMLDDAIRTVPLIAEEVQQKEKSEEY